MKALFYTSLKSNLALGSGFVLQAFFMAVNNAILFVVWWIFFQNFKELRGWQLHDVAALYGIVTGGYGLAAVFGGGALTLSQTIVEGGLDSFMTQPKNLLLYVLGSRSSAPAWGDLMVSSVFLGLSGYVEFSTLPLAATLIFCGAVLFLSSSVLIHSLAFWAPSFDGLTRQLFEFVVVFSVYPQTAFTGVLKIVLFSLIPAGFIGYLPVELLRHFSWGQMFIVLSAALFYGALARYVFMKGLQRYESGNRPVVHG